MSFSKKRDAVLNETIENFRCRPKVSYSYKTMTSSLKAKPCSTHNPYNCSSSSPERPSVKNIGKRIKRKKPLGMPQYSWHAPSPIFSSDSSVASLFSLKCSKKDRKKWDSESNSSNEVGPSQRQKLIKPSPELCRGLNTPTIANLNNEEIAPLDKEILSSTEVGPSQRQKLIKPSPELCRGLKTPTIANLNNEEITPLDKVISENSNAVGTGKKNPKRYLWRAKAAEREVFKLQESLKEQMSFALQLQRENLHLLQANHDAVSEIKRLSGKAERYSFDIERLQSTITGLEKQLVETPCSSTLESARFKYQKNLEKTSTVESTCCCDSDSSVSSNSVKNKSVKLSAAVNIVNFKVLSPEAVISDILEKQSTKRKGLSSITTIEYDPINSDGSNDDLMVHKLKSEIKVLIENFDEIQSKSFWSLQQVAKNLLKESHSMRKQFTSTNREILKKMDDLNKVGDTIDEDGKYVKLIGFRGELRKSFGKFEAVQLKNITDFQKLVKDILSESDNAKKKLVTSIDKILEKMAWMMKMYEWHYR